MKLFRIVSVLAFTLLTGTAAFAAAPSLPAGITAVPLAIVTNDRDSSVSHLELLLDNQARVHGIYMETSAGPNSSGPSKTSEQVYPLAKIESGEGVVLGQGQGVKAIFLRGIITPHGGEGSLVIRYLTNGIFKHYAECRIDLQRLEPDHWQLVNAYDGRPVERIKVRTWALGIATVANVCPGTTLG